MPFYSDLKIKAEDDAIIRNKKKRVIENIKKLRFAINTHFDASRKKTVHKSVKIATWNIREFGKDNYGGRSFEELHYIAEIISNFDIIALQEIRADLSEFKHLLRYLGTSWSFIATDVTDGSAGNQERMVFLYNSDRVRFCNIAGELTLKEGSKIRASFGERVKLENAIKLELDGVDLSGTYDAYTAKSGNKVKLKEDLEIDLPPNSKLRLPNGTKLTLKKGMEIIRPTNGKATVTIPTPLIEGEDFGLRFPNDSFDDSLRQFARTPFLIAFQAGWLKLNLCTVHIYFGSNDIDNKLAQRKREIDLLTEALANKARSENEFDKDSFLGVMGDFNIISKTDSTMQALEQNDFVVPEELKSIPGSNVSRNKAYDQIAFWNPNREFDYSKLDIAGANVFDYYETIFCDDDEAIYRTEGKQVNGLKKSNNYKTWRTYKMSDHLPMWIELRTDFSNEYLEYVEEENELID